MEIFWPLVRSVYFSVRGDSLTGRRWPFGCRDWLVTKGDSRERVEAAFLWQRGAFWEAGWRYFAGILAELEERRLIFWGRWREEYVSVVEERMRERTREGEHRGLRLQRREFFRAVWQRFWACFWLAGAGEGRRQSTEENQREIKRKQREENEHPQVR